MRQGVNRIPRLAFAVFVWLLGLDPRAAWPQSPHNVLARVHLEVTDVADSGAYLIYSYRISNSAESRGGVAVVELDVSAPAGTGRVRLPFTGNVETGGGDSFDRVPLGGIAPPRWIAMVGYKGILDWHVYTVLLNGWPSSYDSVAAGASKEGFGVRSPYLPGVRRFSAVPTEQSCCRTPNAQGELPNAWLLKVQGLTIGPTVRPAEMTLGLLRGDLDQVCGPLHWITDGAVCGSLHAKLATSTPDWRGFLDDLEAQHGAGKPVNDNAYWLLKVNATYLLARN